MADGLRSTMQVLYQPLKLNDALPGTNDAFMTGCAPSVCVDRSVEISSFSSL